MLIRRFVRAGVLLLGISVLTGCGAQPGRRLAVDMRVGGEMIAAADVATTTRAFQDAIDSAAKSAKTLNMPARVVVLGGEYTLGPLQLRSNIELSLEDDAVLRFSRNPADYPLTWVDDGDGPTPGVISPIHGENLTNVSIIGRGVIDGQGDAWRAVKKMKLADDQWNALIKRGGVVNDKQDQWYPSAVVRDGKNDFDTLLQTSPRPALPAFEPYKLLLRPHLVRLTNCRSVKIDGVTFRNGASWNVHLSLCDDVLVRNITVDTAAWAQNGDGIDLDSCRNVLVSDSTFHAGDDAICLKSGKDEAGRRRGRPTENITIARCQVTTGHGGVVIGSEMSGGVRNVFVNDVTFTGTDAGLRFKSTRGRGGVVENVRVDGVKMKDIKGAAILFDLFYAANGKPGAATETANETTPAFRNFDLKNITCDGAGTALMMRGLDEMPVSDVRLTNVEIRNAKKAGQITDAKGIQLTNVRVKAEDGPVKIDPDAEVKLTNCTGIGG